MDRSITSSSRQRISTLEFVGSKSGSVSRQSLAGSTSVSGPATLGLGDQYLEVLALDPEQAKTSSPWSEQIRSLSTPTLWTLAVATPLQSGKPMSRVRSDGFRLDWEIEFTSTPLFFIDWKECPRPAGLPLGGRITALSVTTPEPAMLEGVTGVSVHEGTWRVEATVDDTPLS